MASTTEPANMDTQTVSPVTELAGIPLSLFIIVCALSLLGIIYSIAILIFNVIKQKDKIIKMTSPNINVIVLLGAVFGYASLVLMGLDSSRVSLETMAKLLQGGIFILVLSVTFIYGATFTKSWRVYMIFKNVNANGKLTRDEHLILGLAILVLLDLAILLPWTLVDPISCTQIELSTRYESGRQSDVRTLVDECSSSMLGVWVGVIFGYKAVILGVGCFFTWQTRHVTLPALQDTKEVYLCIFALVSMALVCMPALLTSSIGMTVRYATGSVAVWLTITATITLLFVPKIILYRNSVKEGQKDLKFQFKESMEKTREAVGKCLFCFCCTEKEEDDKYAQEMLHSEIDTLKRTIKEKDSTIRELTDRLYIGTEKFQEYLVSPKRNTTLEAMRRKHERRAKSMHTPASRHKYKLEKQRGMPRHLSLDYEEEGEDDAGLGYMRGEMPACMVDPDTGTFPLPREERAAAGRDGGSLRRQYHERGPDISVINVDQGVNNPNYAGGNPRLGGGGSGQGLPTPAMYTHHTLAAHSPNHDSAIDNNSPSSDTGSSERGDYNNGGFARDDSFKRRADAYSAPIDLEAMESDATNNAAGWPQEPELNNSRAHHPEVRTPNRSLVNHIELEPYRTARINGVSVSQI